MTRKTNSVFSCIFWWACVPSDQHFKSQQHYLKPGYIIQLTAFQWNTPSSPDPSLLVKWARPQPSRGVWAQHYFGTDSRVVVITWNNKILFTYPTLTFTYTLTIIGISGAMYSNWSVLFKSTDLNRLLYWGIQGLPTPTVLPWVSRFQCKSHSLTR